MDIHDIKNADDTSAKGEKTANDTLDSIIRSAEFPDDYAAFEDENLNMIP